METELEKMKAFWKHAHTSSFHAAKTLLKWILLGFLTGSVVGGVATLFSHCLTFCYSIREVYPQVTLALPAAGLLIVFLYRFFKDTNDTGTNMVIASIHSSSDITPKMAPLIFITTILTHLCGGSSGREGAAIQIGGSIANVMGKYFSLNENDRHIIIMCGMSAGFSALFGTPLASAIFALEVISIGIMHYSALVPCTIASFTAHFIALYFHVKPEAFPVASIPAITPVLFIKTMILGISLGIVSILFCIVLHSAEHIYRHFFKNPYLRIFVAGCLILLLCVILRTDSYLGSGMALIEKIFEGGSVPLAAFLLKMVFTGLTLGAGFKGGEIVPSFTIGACFGFIAANLLGMPATLAAACGIVGVFCGVTNCPITSLLLSFELFEFEGMPCYLVTVSVSYMLSGYYGLYNAQRIMYSKTETQFVNRKAH